MFLRVGVHIPATGFHQLAAGTHKEPRQCTNKDEEEENCKKKKHEWKQRTT